MPFGMDVGLGSGHIVLDGDPAPHPEKRGTVPPQFSAHVYCGQTAGWIKMALGMELGLGPGGIVLDGDPAPPIKGHSSNFWPTSIVAKMAGWIKMPLGTKVGLSQMTLC